MKIILTLLIVIPCLVAGAVAFMWSGVYDVAANQSHWKLTEWFIEEVRDHSISARSKQLSAPPSSDPKVMENATYYYFGTCQICHGAPNYPPSEFAKEMNPRPPDFLAEQGEEHHDAESFWVIKNGIKMTGMAAFGRVLKDEEIWAIVHYLKQLHKERGKTS